MSEREEFEKWVRESGQVGHFPTWKAAAERKQREIEELSRENAAIRELMNAYNLGGWTDALSLIKERDELAAQVEVMRDALEESWTEEYVDGIKLREKVKAALYSTPSAALREIEARTLESMIGVFGAAGVVTGNDIDTTLRNTAAAIRKGE